MKRLARLFSVLTLALIVLAVWLLWLAPRPPVPSLPLPVPPRDVPLTGQIDRITIDKSDRRMTAWRDGQAIKTYRIALGFAPDGDKTRQGDGKTPEGVFRIDRRNDRSAYHLSLGIDYPQPGHRARARAAGVDPGGDIFIHGQPNQRPAGEVLPGDWTAGCIAISDSEMRELFAAARIGTEIEIRP
ncbi:MAG: L,D-transpeptidase family protein [Paracoccus sp. (in: a-proteobacteria)]|uniref:L,D-transpeptidase family protein n=1 Tax=Paracoccus sp. TaxID=267 RepID=UPI0026E07675|nr:L,D-transpeptidase family protein [Paracoccus sp. (in: a-proteobacteria)]MDO5630839.1 L,D-transpeptidase family protein [Paracoccus sp. (in: a-proteobacteria)]